MHFKQGDLFWGMSKEFVQEAMETSKKLSCDEGDILFQEGAPADHFFPFEGTRSAEPGKRRVGRAYGTAHR